MQVTVAQDKVLNAIVNVDSQNTWYTCSSQPTNSIIYDLSVTNGKQSPKPPDFGKQKLGFIYEATSSSMNGVITAVLNSTNLESYLDPNAKKIYIRVAASCYVQQPEIVAVTSCNIDKQWDVYTPLCLAVTNPNKRPIQFELSLSFEPDPNVSNNTSELTSTTTATTILSITPSLVTTSGSNLPSLRGLPSSSEGKSLPYAPSNTQSTATTTTTFSDGSRVVSLCERMDLFAISILLIVASMLF
ncbi:4192_t:CDS:2 [Ambispora leptoticha]|uniref:4192_t:CDS:1 n=1 Tax=Ambispora leptoticha TaxID=144679 RepID=A0A9N9AS58_9GLOM|nr:4192_t:CDS:2 [Ambispora leptoticha]